MFRRVFRTKEGKIIAAVLGLIGITIAILTYTNYSDNKKYVEQAVMAENYLKAGNYEQAVEAYLKAMSMKDGDQELLSIGLADAYIGVNNYDTALEVLRSSYLKTSGNKIKEKIEEVTSMKTDYEYLQSISRADIYFSNKEYDKAITEYEKAKLIKSKEVASYRRIAEAYIEKGEYTLAREEVLEGQILTLSDELKETLATVDSYLQKEQYDAIILQAEEYIYQENYEDGIAKYEEAIFLMPQEVVAYSKLAEIYLSRGKYNKAVILLQKAIKLINSDELEDILNHATELKEKEDERKLSLSKLYHALKSFDLDKVISVMNLTFFKEIMEKEAPIYYGIGEGNISDGYGMIIYDKDKVYYGGIEKGTKEGNGIYFMLTESNQVQGYYFYEGEWNNDVPNGTGKVEEMNVLLNGDNETYVGKIITEGGFYNATENEIMSKIFYVDGKETGRISYSAQNGIPKPLTNKMEQPIPIPEAEPYVISALYIGDQPTGEYYSVEPQTIWGVKPFMKKE